MRIPVILGSLEELKTQTKKDSFEWKNAIYAINSPKEGVSRRDCSRWCSPDALLVEQCLRSH